MPLSRRRHRKRAGRHLLDPMVDQAVQDGLDWRDLGNQEPDAGLGNGGLVGDATMLFSRLRQHRAGPLCRSQCITIPT